MCELCEVFDNPDSIKTGLYWDGRDMKILECKTCGVPMGVIREHKAKVSSGMKAKYRNGCKRIFGDDIKIRWKMSKIKDHFHFHIIVPE